MGRRHLYSVNQYFTAGSARAFDGVVLSGKGNVLIHAIRVWNPAGNEYVKIYAKRQDYQVQAVNQMVAEADGDKDITVISEPILLTPEVPRIQVYVDQVFSDGKFSLEIEYEEVM